ncbi:hypothetical protein COO60DRAFT_1574280 [Scenedesmus sp. NREL 46B-D3]|nr:hypothetical protein COO60DRAFT_1574280 [Scenedesmus sp. NREL 46B-D3]
MYICLTSSVTRSKLCYQLVYWLRCHSRGFWRGCTAAFAVAVTSMSCESSIVWCLVVPAKQSMLRQPCCRGSIGLLESFHGARVLCSTVLQVLQACSTVTAIVTSRKSAGGMSVHCVVQVSSGLGASWSRCCGTWIAGNTTVPGTPASAVAPASS